MHKTISGRAKSTALSVLLLSVAVIVLKNQAHAQNDSDTRAKTKSMSTALIKVYDSIMYIDLAAAQCQEKAPEALNREALANWQMRNRVKQIKSSMNTIQSRSHQVAAIVEQAESSYLGRIQDDMNGREQEFCSNLEKLFEYPKLNPAQSRPNQFAQVLKIAEITAGAKGPPNDLQKDDHSTDKAPREKANEEPDEEARLLARITAFGKGVPAKEIEGIYHWGENKFRIDGVRFKEYVYLLLNDGWAYTRLRIPPSDLDMAASRRLEPEAWQRWRRSGSEFELKDPDTGKWELTKADRVKPFAPVSEDELSLVSMKSVSSGGFGGAVFTKRITFKTKGRFERSSGSLMGTGVMQAQAGVNAQTVTSRSKEGAQTATGTSGGGVTTARSSESEKGAAHMTGKYRIDGYTLILHTDGGRTEHHLIFRWGPDNVFINEMTYSPPDEDE